MIVVNDVHKRYKTDQGLGPWVLRGVSLTIPSRCSVGLIGRNGAGKSTLLGLIGGVDKPTRGTITRDCRVSFPLGLAGGMQGALTGRQNAKFVCRMYGRDADMPALLEGICEFAELGTYFDQPVKTYSTGMTARLRFAISLAFDFDVYLVDEVTAVGDAIFKRKSMDAFRKLADHAGLIMVTHDENALKQFCKAGILLENGHATWFDDVGDALATYRKNQKT